MLGGVGLEAQDLRTQWHRLVTVAQKLILLWREEKCRTSRKTLRVELRSTNESQPTYKPGIDPRLQWWQRKMLTTAVIT